MRGNDAVHSIIWLKIVSLLLRSGLNRQPIYYLVPSGMRTELDGIRVIKVGITGYIQILLSYSINTPWKHWISCGVSTLLIRSQLTAGEIVCFKTGAIVGFNVSFISMYRNGIGGIAFSISSFSPYVSNTTFRAAMVLLALLVILYVSQAEPGKRIRCPLPSNAFRPRRGS